MEKCYIAFISFLRTDVTPTLRIFFLLENSDVLCIYPGHEKRIVFLTYYYYYYYSRQRKGLAGALPTEFTYIKPPGLFYIKIRKWVTVIVRI